MDPRQDNNNMPKDKAKVLKSAEDTRDLNDLTQITGMCSVEYPGSSLKSTPVFDSDEELVKLKKTNV